MWILNKRQIMELIFENQLVIAVGVMFMIAYVVIVVGFKIVKLILGER